MPEALPRKNPLFTEDYIFGHFRRRRWSRGHRDIGDQGASLARLNRNEMRQRVFDIHATAPLNAAMLERTLGNGFGAR